jgi:RNA polymerase sigma factor (sigma-70 family)
MDDLTLLNQYAADRSADAFAALVTRHVSLVYSAALRQVNRPDMAEDVTQAVFIALSRRALAGSLARPGFVLSAWLLTATRYASIDALKRQARRTKHEHRAAAMRSEIPPTSSESEPESTWDAVRPVLDAALLALPEKDRRAVVLRYFEGRSFDEVGQATGATREAAKQRIFRAIERLRSRLLGKGVAVSAAALGTMIGANAVQAAPPALAGACSAVAATTASAAAAVAAVPQIAHAALAAMTWAKLKIAITAVAAVLAVAASVATITAVANQRRAQAAAPTPRLPAIPVADPAPPAPPADDANWLPPFLEAYAPKEGRVVRLVPPPFIKQRWNWWKSQQPRIPPLKPGEPMFERMFTIEFDARAKQFNWKLASVVDGDLNHAMRWVAGVRPWEVAGPDQLRTAALPGDWVYLKASTKPDRADDIARIVSATLKRKITIKPVTRKTDVVVIKGQFQPKTAVDDRGRHIVEVGLGEKVEPAPGAPDAFGPPSSATLRQLFDYAEDITSVQFVDETDWGRTRVMMKRFVGEQKAKADELRRLMTRLMGQTGLELQLEARDVDVWEVAEEK